jgi:hypothetical protein
MTDLGPQKQPYSVNQVQAQTRSVIKDLQCFVTHPRQMTDEQLRYMAPMAGIGKPYQEELIRRQVMEITLGGSQKLPSAFL